MAKDGTNRGGRRAGAGRKPKALLEKIDEGREATVMDALRITGRSKQKSENVAIMG